VASRLQPLTATEDNYVLFLPSLCCCLRLKVDWGVVANAKDYRYIDSYRGRLIDFVLGTVLVVRVDVPRSTRILFGDLQYDHLLTGSTQIILVNVLTITRTISLVEPGYYAYKRTKEVGSSR
jgi:hypothetical protein